MIAGSDDACYTPRDSGIRSRPWPGGSLRPRPHGQFHLRRGRPPRADPHPAVGAREPNLPDFVRPQGRQLWISRSYLEAFQAYFRENSESWLELYGHREAGPHLVLQSYLHRVVYGGGRITREYALARGRSDLLIEWPRPGGTVHSNPSKHVIECKGVGERSGLESVVREGLRQTERPTWTCAARSPETWWSSTSSRGSPGRSGSSGGAQSRAKCRLPCGACESGSRRPATRRYATITGVRTSRSGHSLWNSGGQILRNQQGASQISSR